MTPVVAIVGRPNVGKSTLFNRLVGKRQAITSAEAGTTRDPVHGEVDWSGRYFLLVDTAGVGYDNDELAGQVADQIKESANVADLILLVVDSSGIVTSQDMEAARLALKTGKPVVMALNKADIGKRDAAAEFYKLGVKQAVEVSSSQGTGTGDLLDIIIGHLPKVSEPKKGDTLRVAFLGRPNVGKSTLFNQLSGSTKAITAELAGTTRDINRIAITKDDHTVELLDTAGFRKRGKILPGIEKFSILRTLAAINESDICVVLMDAGEPATAIDQSIAGLAKEAGKGVILVVNKWDAIEKDDKTMVRMERSIQHRFQFVWWAPLVFASALNGKNTEQILTLAADIADRTRQTISDEELTALLKRCTMQQPPPGKGNRHPTLKKMTQVGHSPPSFLVEGTQTKMIHFSYARFIENQLREAFDFTGSPIRLIFKDKDKK